MVAGISGPTPGSGAGADEDEPKLGRLMPPPQAPRNDRQRRDDRQIGNRPRAYLNLTMAFPRIKFLAAPVTQPSAKPLSEQ